MRREPGHRRNSLGRKAVILALVAGLNLTGAGAALAGDFQPGHNQTPASAGNQSQEPHTEVETRIREGEGRTSRSTDESTR